MDILVQALVRKLACKKEHEVKIREKQVTRCNVFGQKGNVFHSQSQKVAEGESVRDIASPHLQSCFSIVPAAKVSQ